MPRDDDDDNVDKKKKSKKKSKKSAQVEPEFEPEPVVPEPEPEPEPEYEPETNHDDGEADARVPGDIDPNRMLRRAAMLGDCDQIRLAHSLGADVNDPDCGEDKSESESEEEEEEEKSKSKSKSGSKTGSKSGSKSGSDDGKAKRKKLVIPLNTGDTALHLAAEHGHLEAVQLLLDLMADIDRANKIESTPFHRAVSCGRLEIAEFLIDRKANIHALNKIGNTPMHCACFMQDLEMIKLLLANNCREDLMAVNFVGVMAFDYGQIKLKSYLLQHMPASFQERYRLEQEQAAQAADLAAREPEIVKKTTVNTVKPLTSAKSSGKEKEKVVEKVEKAEKSSKSEKPEKEKRSKSTERSAEVRVTVQPAEDEEPAPVETKKKSKKRST